MANSIVREREVAGNGQTDKPEIQGGGRGVIVGEVMADILFWRRLRDDTFEHLWDEYYAKWRGFWMPRHKSFKTERSKLISPLTSMSIDLTAAEIIEAVLGREYFIDLPDNVGDADTGDMEAARILLVEDLRNEDFVDEFAATVLNGCLYGTGITKIQINTKIVKTPSRAEDGKLIITEKEVVQIKPIAIEPGSFVADPASPTIDGMKGCAHEFTLPLTTIKQRQKEGIYYDDITIGSWRARQVAPNRGDTESGNRRDQGDVAYITEYYGLVSERSLLLATLGGNEEDVSSELLEGIPEGSMVEAIVTVANETHLLRAIRNPLKTDERLIVGYQHEVVPNRAYGRGVAEKGANIQRAMDAEMRARIDGLAWSSLPMFAYDLTRMPPNTNLNAWPGKGWGTRGNPNEVIKEFRVSGPDQNSYAHIQDLERMGQQATGALDSPGLRSGMRDETATGSALAASSFIKRSKRTMYNVEGYMNRLVKRVLRLKMQFEPARYPQDYDFQVKGSIGMMAREIEQQFMTNLVSVLGPDSPASMPIITAIFEHSSSPVKGDVLKALKALSEQKPSPEEEAAKAAQLALPVKQVEKLEAEIMKIQQEAVKTGEQSEKISVETDLLEGEEQRSQGEFVLDIEEAEDRGRQLDILEERNDLTREGLRIQEKAIDKKVPKSTQ